MEGCRGPSEGKRQVTGDNAEKGADVVTRIFTRRTGVFPRFTVATKLAYATEGFGNSKKWFLCKYLVQAVIKFGF